MGFAAVGIVLAIVWGGMLIGGATGVALWVLGAITIALAALCIARIALDIVYLRQAHRRTPQQREQTIAAYHQYMNDPAYSGASQPAPGVRLQDTLDDEWPYPRPPTAPPPQ